MNDTVRDDWDPASPEVQRDQRAAYDAMREQCPVAYSASLGWTLFRHRDVLDALHAPDTFSNIVSVHRAVPNGMDPPEHTAYRRIVETYFVSARMAAFEPRCRAIAAELVESLRASDEIEFVADCAYRFSVQVQCAFLGWPPELEEPMHRWTQRNYKARASGERQATTQIAQEFEGYVIAELQARRAAATPADADISASLLHERVDGRPLHDNEIVSILRNWTVGEVGTIAASVAILVHYIAQHPDLQRQLREEPAALPVAIDEILRLHGPLVSNRRRTTRSVEIGGRQIAAGERVTLNWIAANRDSRVFADPDTFRTDRDPAANLLYGAGLHVCPGAPLARLELRVMLEELLARTRSIDLVPGKPAAYAIAPASGFETLFVRFR